MLRPAIRGPKVDLAQFCVDFGNRGPKVDLAQFCVDFGNRWTWPNFMWISGTGAKIIFIHYYHD